MSFTKLAQASGCVIFQKDQDIYIVEQANKWTGIVRYITMLLAFILGGNGIFTFVMYLQDKIQSITMPLIFTSIGLLFVLLLFWVQRVKVKADVLTPDHLKVFCVISTSSGVLLSSQQSVLAKLAEVKLSKQFNLASSSPNLVISWPGGKVVIAKGNFFDGGITPLSKVLSRYIAF